MLVRPLRADEGLAYREVRLRALRLAPTAYGSRLEEEEPLPESHWCELAARSAAEAGGGTVFVLDRAIEALGGPLAGTTYVRVEDQPPGVAYIGAMWVDEDLRGSDWASRLIEAAEHWALRRGATGVHLWVVTDNDRAWRFYARHGYQPTGQTEPAAYGDSLELYRPLAPLPSASAARE